LSTLSPFTDPLHHSDNNLIIVPWTAVKIFLEILNSEMKYFVKRSNIIFNLKTKVKK
jgi:hypothetical protein